MQKEIKIHYMEERYIAAVDLGSSKIALTVAKVSGNDIQIQFYKEVPSAGIRNNAVFNPALATAPIREVIECAEKELNIKILQTVVGLPRCDVRQENNSAKAIRSFPDECISETEVEELKSNALDNYPLADGSKEEIYGAVAQSFDCDDNFQIIENEIVGMVSEEFTGNFKLFIGKKSSVKTIDTVFNKLQIAVAQKCFTPDALAKAVLTEDEKESGVALIDLGGGATSVSIYKSKILRHYASIPFGGKAITGDIKNECMISETLAENLKKAYGACMPEKLVTLAEKIIQIEGEEGMTGPKQVPVKYMSEIITARAAELVNAMLWEIQESGLADALRSGIVITGGGANLCNIAPLIKELSGYDVRVGYPRPLFSASGCSNVKDPAAATVLGMILAVKNDTSLNCIEPGDYEEYGETVEVVNDEEEERKYVPVEELMEEAEDEPEYTAPSIPEGAEEGETVNIFGEDQVEEVKAEKPKKAGLFGKKKEKKVKEKKEKETSFLAIQWQKAKNFVEEMYDNAGQDSV